MVLGTTWHVVRVRQRWGRVEVDGLAVSGAVAPDRVEANHGRWREVRAMTTPVVLAAPDRLTIAGRGRGGPWVIAAFITQLGYVLCLPAMLAFGCLLGDVFGHEPAGSEGRGFAAVLADVLVALFVVPLPSSVGAALAVKAWRLGAGTSATAALIPCALIGPALARSSLPITGG